MDAFELLKTRQEINAQKKIQISGLGNSSQVRYTKG